MGRPIKETAEYFPHFVKGGRTLFILESKYGNDGYAFWFKLLEILCYTNNHFFDCKNPSNWEFLLAKTRTTEEIANKIITTLVDLGKIDAELWENKVIWVQSLVDKLSFFYERRSVGTPQKPQFLQTETPNNDSLCTQKPSQMGVNANEKYTIEENRKEKNIYNYHYIVERWNETCGNCLPKAKTLNESRRQKIKLRLQEFGDSEAAQMEVLNTLLDKIVASSFLKGDNNNSWTATFDWLFENSKNWVKVIEGNYDDNRGLKNNAKQLNNAGTNLGIGEYIEQATGRRTYGTGKATIPHDAPARPSERHSWDAGSQSWIII